MLRRLTSATLALTAAAALAAVALPAAAGTVTIDTRPYDGIVDPSSFTGSADYVAGWTAVHAANPTAPAGYGDFTIADWDGFQNNQGLTGGGAATNLAFFDQATFDVSAADAGLWSFRLGIDFGLGGTLLVDGVELDTKTYDLWWGGAGNYGNTSQLLAGSVVLGAGSHTLQAYGFEACCDGGTGGQFLAPTAREFQDFTTTTGGVPEPAAWALMILGFGGAGATLRRRRATTAPVCA